MTEISCSIVRELLPLYIEDLTGDDSRRLIEEHILHCEGCRELLSDMREGAGRGPEMDSADARIEAEAIDYMKKSNRRIRNRTVFGVITALLLIVCLILGRRIFAARYISAEQVVIESLHVNGSHVSVEGSLRDPSQGVSSLTVTSENGEVTIDMGSRIKNPFSKNSFSAVYDAGEEIKSVKLIDSVIWEDGKEIPESVSRVFAAKHPYIGEMYRNGLSAQALEIPKDLGPYRSELQTEEEPYGWKIYLDEDMGLWNWENLVDRLHYYSAMLIATIDNLDTVEFIFDYNNTAYGIDYTEADADTHYGRSVKDSARTVSGLYELMKEW